MGARSIILVTRSGGYVVRVPRGVCSDPGGSCEEGEQMNQENKIGKLLPADKITFFGTGFSTGEKYGTEVMRITRDGVWVNPDVAVDDTAKAVLQAISSYVEVLVQRAVVDEREACAKLLDEMAAEDKLSNYYQVAALRIRERGAP